MKYRTNVFNFLYSINNQEQSSETQYENKPLMIAQLDSLQRLKEYWGPLSWIDAEQLLQDKQDYSFLVRDSNHHHYFLAITFKSEGNIHPTACPANGQPE